MSGEDDRSKSRLTEIAKDVQRDTPLRAQTGEICPEYRERRTKGRVRAVGQVDKDMRMKKKDWSTSLWKLGVGAGGLEL